MNHARICRHAARGGEPMKPDEEKTTSFNGHAARIVCSGTRCGSAYGLGLEFKGWQRGHLSAARTFKLVLVALPLTSIGLLRELRELELHLFQDIPDAPIPHPWYGAAGLRRIHLA